MLYLGIDVGKNTHVAALLSSDLLVKHKKYDSCPVQKIENSRAGFTALLTIICKQSSPDECRVLLEHTGHYGFALEQFLQENGICTYRMLARKRYATNKTDTHDARALAVLLYNQIELAIPLVNESERVHPLVPASASARTLRGLVRHRYELQHEATQRKNKLTAIADELFPELTVIYKDPNTESALALRDQYPTPADVVRAEIEDVCATRKRTQPSREQLLELQQLARQSIGTKDASRCISLVFEQQLLSAELRLFREHIARLDTMIEEIVSVSREGQILTSFTGIGTTQAGIILSNIGSIANYESIAKFRAYLGWSPRQSQTGTTYDSTSLNRAGNVLLKQTLYLIVLNAITYDPHWKALYDRLVKQKCAFDARTGKYKGKMKVIGRVAGQLAGVIYTLLRKDYDLLASVPPGTEPPAPTLYVVESKRRE